MTALGAASNSGDTAIFYFSGHGAQAPDQSGDEGGGYDEILLPADAAGWKGSIGAVENALLDDELQDWAAGLLARGVRVVGVIDACHSATGFRALGLAGRARGLGPEALGIPPDLPLAESAPAPALEGPFVFLYSSQSDQRSFEYPLADGSAWHGEFTLRLAQVLRDANGASWAQVASATAGAMLQGAARQDPDAEGPLLSQQVFGDGPGAARIAVQDGMLQAGLLQGLQTGAEIAFFAAPAASKPLGTAFLTKVTAREGRFDAPPPAGALWAEVIAPAPVAPLALAAPQRADPADGHDYAAWLAALGPPAFATPDLVPVLTGGELALVGADGVLDPAGPGSSPRVRPLADETPADALARVLDNARHAHHLRKLMAAVAGRSLTGGPGLEVRYFRRPGNLQGETCTAPQKDRPVDPATGLQPCDQLWLDFKNVAGGDLEVSVLYFNADFTITGIWPQRGLSNLLAPGERARAGLLIAPGLPGALEELMVLAVPLVEGTERVDLTRLASPGLSRQFPDADSSIETWFEQRLAQDGTNRGFSTKPAALLMTRQTVRVLSGTP
jgi:hypothetical protein